MYSCSLYRLNCNYNFNRFYAKDLIDKSFSPMIDTQTRSFCFIEMCILYNYYKFVIYYNYKLKLLLHFIISLNVNSD